MEQLTPPRADPLDEAILAWAESGARLAARLRNAPLPRPQLTLAPEPCAAMSLACAVAYCPLLRAWQHTWHCACQWHLAFEIHPVFHPGHWAGAAAASIAWQLYDRLKTVPRGNPRMGGPSPLGGKVARIMLHHRRGLPACDAHPVFDTAAGI